MYTCVIIVYTAISALLCMKPPLLSLEEKKTEKSYFSGQRYQDTHPEGQALHILFAESANSEQYGFLIFACASLEISALLDCYVHAFQEHKMGYILWRRPDACFEDFWRLSRHFLSLFRNSWRQKQRKPFPVLKMLRHLCWRQKSQM